MISQLNLCVFLSRLERKSKKVSLMHPTFPIVKKSSQLKLCVFFSILERNSGKIILTHSTFSIVKKSLRGPLCIMFPPCFKFALYISSSRYTTTSILWLQLGRKPPEGAIIRSHLCSFVLVMINITVGCETSNIGDAIVQDETFDNNEAERRDGVVGKANKMKERIVRHKEVYRWVLLIEK